MSRSRSRNPDLTGEPLGNDPDVLIERQLGNVIPLAAPDTADDLDLDAMLGELRQEGDRTYEVKIYKQPAGNQSRQEFLFAYAPGDLNYTALQVKLQSEYGPGVYRGRIYERGIEDEVPYTRLVRNFQLAIGARTINAPAPQGGADLNELVRTLLADRSKPAPQISGLDPMMAMIIDQQRQSTENMFRMFGLMLPLLVNRPASDPIDQLGKMLALTDRLRGEGGEGGDDSVLGQVLGAVKEIGPPLIHAVAGARQGGRAAIPASATPAAIAADQIDPKLREALMEYGPQLTQLPFAIQMGYTPEKVAGMILDSIEDEIQLDAIKVAITHPQILHGIVAIVPAMGKYAAWLTKLVELIATGLPEVEADFIEEPAPGEGDGGDGADHGDPSSPA